MDFISIVLFRGEIYLPTIKKFQSGQPIEVDPVIICGFQREEVKNTIEIILNGQKDLMPDPKSWNEIFQQSNQPMLRATKTRSWKKMTSESTSYLVTFSEQDISISISQLNKKGIQEFPSTLQKVLPRAVPIEEIVEIILKDMTIRKGFEK